MEQKPRPDHIPEDQWTSYRHLATEAIRAMDMYLEARTEAGANELHDLRRALELLQNQHQPIPFGVARVIENQQAVIMETALRIVATPMRAADWCYRIARMYAERYNSRYGTGLIPDSAEAVEEIVDFWCRYYFGLGLDAWHARSAK